MAAAAGVVLFALSVVGLAAPGWAAGSTFEVTSRSCTGPGSIVEAVTAANTTPGTDTITFTPRLVVDVTACPPPYGGAGSKSRYYLAHITESVDIVGNGAKLQGYLYWVSPSGTQSFSLCPTGDPATMLTAMNPGFLEVGTRGADNSAITVTVDDLDLDQLPSIATVRNGATLEISGSTLTRIYRADDCEGNVLSVDDATLRLTDVTIARVREWSGGSILGSTALIAGSGRLEISGSRFEDNVTGYAVYWVGRSSSADIVSSLFNQAGGIANLSPTMNVVNSAFLFSLSPRATERLAQLGYGTMNVTASTISAGSARCTAPDCRNTGWTGTPLFANGGRIQLASTAIGVLLPTEPGNAVIQTVGDGEVRADPLTWIQPVEGQDAAALRTATDQPGLRTDPPGLPTGGVPTTVVQAITPLLGTSATPSVLIDAVPDANTRPNVLVDPITNTPIASDVLGNPRVDGNGTRTIGAVQLTLAPHLTVAGVGDGLVDLNWSRPQDPSSGPITGYTLRYRPAGSTDPFQSIPISGPTTLSRQVAGLVNGDEYEFVVAANNCPASPGPCGDGPPSNTVRATPLGPVGTPQVTATPGESSVTLSWTEPPTGGHPGPLTYLVAYRPVGTAAWIQGPASLSARTAVIPGLTGGTPYEFGVVATSTDATAGSLGTATATPLAPTSTPAPSPSPAPSPTPAATPTPAAPADSSAPRGTGGGGRGPAALAASGADVGPVALAAAALIGLGAATVLGSRARRQH